MRIETLYEYMVLSHYLNYTSAARNLHLSQPNLSRHILELEQELGVTLLTRGKDIQLTPAGSAFLEDVIQIHHSYKAALERCRAIHQNSVEEVVIQEPYIIDALGEILYQTVRAFRAEYPLEPIRLFAERGKKSLESLEARHIDIGITVDCGDVSRLIRHGEKKGLIFIPVIREPLRVWLHKNHELAKKDVLTLDDLACVPINMTASRHFDPMRYSLIDLFGRNGLDLDLRTYSFITLEEFYLNTQHEDAVFLITPSVAKNPVLRMQDQMTTIPINDARARQVSYLVLKDDYTKKSIDSLLKVMEKVVAESANRDPESEYLSEIVD